MATKVGINGFGRIGRLAARGLMKNPAIDLVAVNDITDAKTLAFLFQYDSVHGKYPGTVSYHDNYLVIDGKEILVKAEADPAKLAWSEQGVQVVVESTGKFTEKEKAIKHIEGGGAKKVIISAPAKGEDVTIVMGVNEGDYDPAKHSVLSNASCTTNCLGPVVKVLIDNFGVKRGLMTTIHSYTNDQRILDQPHKDLRRARAATLSMIPTTTGAAKAIGKVIPAMKGKLDGLSIRVPTPNVSLVDLVVELEKPVESVDVVNQAMKAAAEGPLKGILGYNDDPLVSKDFNGDPRSSIFDAIGTYLVDKTLVKVMAWYDNEWAYSLRVVDLIVYMAKRGL